MENRDYSGEATKLLLEVLAERGDTKVALEDYQSRNGIKFCRLELDYIRDAVSYQWCLTQRIEGVPQKYWTTS